MPSHKQKKEKKRSHKHKHRNRDRSAAKRHEKIEGKKENIPHNKSAWDTDVTDVSTYIDNRREMIRQMFSSVGEEFIANKVPVILKASREELKKICLEELTRMSSDVIFKILEGIPVDSETTNTVEEASRKEKVKVKCSKNLHEHTSGASSACKHDKGTEECEEPHLDLGLDEEEIEIEECAGGSKAKEESSGTEGSPSENEGEESEASEEIFNSMKDEAPSTSYQPSTPKKLAKVAPFNVCRKTVEEPSTLPAPSVEASQENNDEDDDSGSYEMVDLGLEEEIDVEGMDDATEAVVVPPENSVGENDDNQAVSEEEMQQNLSEMRELEHRARAIRSMLANIDKLQV